MPRTSLCSFLFLVGALITAGPAVAAQAEYTNAVLVSVDPGTRLIVVKNNQGGEETLKLDDNVSGLEGLAKGDAVILTVRGEPAMRRVSAVVKSSAAKETASAVTTEPAPGVDAKAAQDMLTYGQEVAELSRRAAAVDSSWQQFRTICSPTVSGDYDGGREWFGLWENRVKADLSIGTCRELYNQILDRGEAIKASMVRAEETARLAGLLPGDMRRVRRQNSLDWEGWGLPSPDRQPPL
jgi:hypothetical protein